MQVQIVFTSFGCCSAIGNFAPGDTARIGEAMAAHLVYEARCARYAAAPMPEPAPRKKRRSK